MFENANGSKFSHGVFIIGVFILGETHAILALSGNIPLLKLLLTAMTNNLLKTFADSFISFGGILSIPADFLH